VTQENFVMAAEVKDDKEAPNQMISFTTSPYAANLPLCAMRRDLLRRKHSNRGGWKKFHELAQRETDSKNLAGMVMRLNVMLSAARDEERLQ